MSEVTHHEYITKLFPDWMALFPGGNDYDETIPMRERVLVVHTKTKELVAAMMLLNCRVAGNSLLLDRLRGRRLTTPTKVMARYLNSGKMRNDRKHWKEVMANNKMFHAFFPWQPEVPDQFGKKKWIEFRAVLTDMLPYLEELDAAVE
jgi:hypothetical protein